MGSRIVIFGELHISREAFDRAQNTCLIEFFFEDPDDEGSFHPKGVPTSVLLAADGEFGAWARNFYDASTSRWTFSASIHDDDWQNADPETLTGSLADLKDRVGTDFLLSFTEWNQEFEGAWRIDSNEAAALSDLPPVPDEIRRALESAEIEVALEHARSLQGVSIA